MCKLIVLKLLMISVRLIELLIFSVVDDLRAVLSKLESRMAVLEKSQAPASKTVTVTKVDVKSCPHKVNVCVLNKFSDS